MNVEVGLCHMNLGHYMVGDVILRSSGNKKVRAGPD